MGYLVPSFPGDTGSGVPPTTINNSIGPWLPSGGQIPFQVTTYQLTPDQTPKTVILTNQDQAQAAYTANIQNPAQWDSLFQAAMVASLGAFLVPALSLSLPLMDRSIKAAEGAIHVARAMDGNEGVTTMDHLPDWIAARAGAGSSGWSYWGYFTNGALCYQNMCWPNGGGTYG
jgi:hypothetical protein